MSRALGQAEGKHLARRLVAARPLGAARDIKISADRGSPESVPPGRHRSKPQPAILFEIEAFVHVIGPLVVLAAQENDRASQQCPGTTTAWRRHRWRGRP